MKGYLYNQKQGQVYFMLIDNMLYAMQDENAAPSSCLNIEYSQLYLPRCGGDDPRGYSSKPRPSNFSLEIRSPDGNNLVLQAANRHEIKLWEKALSRQMMRSDFQKRFRPLKRLKTLGFGGELSECVSTKSGKSFAIKVYSRQFLDQDIAKREAVNREIAILRKLSHPNVSNLIETHQTDRTICLIYEFLDCDTLQDVLQKNRKLSRTDILAISKGMLQGVQYLKSKGISHNMINPANILLKKTSKGYLPTDVIIVDFKKGTIFGDLKQQQSSEEQDHSLDLKSHDETALQKLQTFMQSTSIDFASCKSVMSLRSAENLMIGSLQHQTSCSDCIEVGKCIISMVSCGTAVASQLDMNPQPKLVINKPKISLILNVSLEKKNNFIERKKEIDLQLLAVARGLVNASECGQAAIEEALKNSLFQRISKSDESEVQDQANEFKPRERFQFNLRLKSIPSIERKLSPFIKFKRGSGNFDTTHTTNKPSVGSPLNSSSAKKFAAVKCHNKIEQPQESPAPTQTRSIPRRLSFDFSKAITLRLQQSDALKKSTSNSAIQTKLGRLSSFGRTLERSANFELLL